MEGGKKAVQSTVFLSYKPTPSSDHHHPTPWPFVAQETAVLTPTDQSMFQVRPGLAQGGEERLMGMRLGQIDRLWAGSRSQRQSLGPTSPRSTHTGAGQAQSPLRHREGKLVWGPALPFCSPGHTQGWGLWRFPALPPALGGEPLCSTERLGSPL